MDRIKRNERLAAMARVLTGTPNRLYTLSHFTEMFGAAKSTVSEDLSILADTFAQFDLGRLSTVAGAAGGVIYRAIPSREKRIAALEELSRRLTALDDMMADIGQFAAQEMDLPVVAFTVPAAVTISRFDFIYVDVNTFIMVLLLSDNTVKTKLVHLPVSVERARIDKLATLANTNFTGVDASEITPLRISAAERALDDTMGLTAVAASFAIETLEQAAKPDGFVVGQNRLLHHPEFQNPEKAQSLMTYLTQLPHEIPALETDATGVRVYVGPESASAALKDSSVVLATYDAGGGVRGVVGVVGPTRMDYALVASKMQYIAQTLSQVLTGGRRPPLGMDTKLMIRGDDADEQEKP